MADLLAVNGILAAAEGLAYGATAVALWRKGGPPIRRRLVAWWALGCIGLLSSASLLLVASNGTPSLLFVRLHVATTLLLSAMGVILLGSFLWFLLRGVDRIALFAIVFGGLAVVSTAAVLLTPGRVVVESLAARIAYDAGPPPALFLQGIASLAVMGLAVWLFFASRRMRFENRKRARLLATAVLLFYVGKAIVGATLTAGTGIELLVLTRAMGLLAAGLGVAAYPLIEPKAQASPSSN